MFTAVLFTIAKIWKQLKCPSVDEWIKKKNCGTALAGVAQWIEHGPATKGLLVQFPVRACAWVVGQVPGGDAQEATTH